MFDRWRQRLAKDSVFRHPLVFDITLVLVLKCMLLFVLWTVFFKPLKLAVPASVEAKILPPPPAILNNKEINHD